VNLLVNDFKIFFDPGLRPYLTGKVIDYQQNFFGKFDFVIYGTSACY